MSKKVLVGRPPSTRAATDAEVPGARWSERQLCRVQAKHGKIKAGDIVCRNGAFQRRYLVEYVEYRGVGQNGFHGWAVGLRNLGNFYADDQVYLAKKSAVTELIWHTKADGVVDTHYNWRVVTPVGGLKPPKPLTQQPGQYQAYEPYGSNLELVLTPASKPVPQHTAEQKLAMFKLN